MNNPNLSVDFDKIKYLFTGKRKGQRSIVATLALIGIFLTPYTLLGCLWFYARWYNRFTEDNERPNLKNLPPMAKAAMVTGAIVVWVLAFLTKWFFSTFVGVRFDRFPEILGLLAGELILIIPIIVFFYQWKKIQDKLIFESTRYGSAKLSEDKDFRDLKMNPKGIYIGNNDYKFADNGHILTVAGTRGGKAVNLLISNLLGNGNYEGSWVVIDPKGELYAVTHRYQESIGQKVVVLDPWKIMTKTGSSYNPFDLIDPTNPDSLVDDAKMIAKMIVPEVPGASEPFWDNRARSWITGFIIFIMIQDKNDKVEKNLYSLWYWLRVPEKEFLLFVHAMQESKNKIVKGTANEILNAFTNDKMYSSIMANVFDATDFLSSPSLQSSMLNSSFDLNNITDGKTTLYVIIPADRLNSQSKWLRLIVSTALTASIRNRNKKITFMMDEFSSLGKMDIVESFMGISSGYGITLWPIIQNLTQLEINYGKNWQTFIGNATVRHYFSINDNFTAKYVSDSIGSATMFTHIKVDTGQSDASARLLLTPDEVRAFSGENIFLQVGQRDTTMFYKSPYYNDVDLVKRADENPYSDIKLPDPKTMLRIVKYPGFLDETKHL